MKKIPSLGEQEMELLKYIGEYGPASVREVATYFEKERRLARTTVLTVMERLRKKGFLGRVKSEGVFKYRAKFKTGDVLSHKVMDFIDKTLGGSVSPLISYFLNSKNLSATEIAQLKELAEKLQSGEKK